MSVFLLGVMILCAVALAFVVAFNGWVAFARPRAFRRLVEAGHVVDGIVVHRPKLVIPGDAAVHSPDGAVTLIDVEFTDSSGTTHRVRSGGGTTRFPAVGTRVRVAFDPENPQRALIEDDVRNARKICLLVLAIFTPMLIAVALGLFLIDF